MTLAEQINEDVKAAMKAKDKDRLNAVRDIKSKILLAKTASGKDDVSDAEVLAMLQKLSKQRKESADLYAQQGRQDLADEELKQLAFIEAYLPKPLSEAEIESKIKEIIAQTGASSIKDMGKVMGAANKAMAGQADGKVIADLVKKLLNS